MAQLDGFLATCRPWTLSLLRIIIGLLFLEHGTSKYLSLPVSQMTGAHPMTLSGFNGIIEIVGGVLVVLGLFTRPVAFILAGDMAVAYFIAHAPRGFFPLLNGGELAIVYCFIFLYLAVAGGGPWSIDHLWAGRGRAQPHPA
jgi:putative oxidoreductase